MGILNKLLGNAQEIDTEKLEAQFSEILLRLILVDKQGITGKKTEYLSIPYKEISRFSVETAGTFDMDSELKIYISGNDNPTVKKDFGKGTDVKGVQKTLATYILTSK